MQHLMVILDNSADVWQAAYTAYDVAARSGASLVGVLVTDEGSHARALQTLRKFEMGARAAGVRVTTREITVSLSGYLKTHSAEMDGVFISRTSLNSPHAFDDLLNALSCPLWIVSTQRPIRRLLAIESAQAAGPELALSLARRWGLSLKLLTPPETSGIPEQPSESPAEIVRQAVPSLDLTTLLSQIEEGNIDLAVLNWPGNAIPAWQASQAANCLVVFSPALNSH